MRNRPLAERVAELRLAGVDWERIAESLGLPDAEAAKDAASIAGGGVAQEPQEILMLEIARIDRLHTALWPKAMKGDQGAVDRLLRLSTRRMLLHECLAKLQAAETNADAQQPAEQHQGREPAAGRIQAAQHIRTGRWEP